VIATVGVVVPAADEAEYLPACLDALTRTAAELLHACDVEVRIVVVLDGCTDESASVVEAYQDVQSISISSRCVGAARRAGCDLLLASAPDPSTLWLANTDADSRVGADWLPVMRECAESGAQLVLGTVQPAAGLPARIQAAWHARHVLAEGHPHVHGANFGIRGDIYQRLGGWPERAIGEDRTLAQAAEVAGARIIRTARIPVITSARLSARAPYGFASYLSGLVADA
jgi:cellulose synthase/poly-beta-1,6-N-acetylglucosamine synthase-like glycosyltransferase